VAGWGWPFEIGRDKWAGGWASLTECLVAESEIHWFPRLNRDAQDAGGRPIIGEQIGRSWEARECVAVWLVVGQILCRLLQEESAVEWAKPGTEWRSGKQQVPRYARNEKNRSEDRPLQGQVAVG